MPDLPDVREAGRDYGAILRAIIGAGKPMGSWTGLPPALGAPISGALVGAALGGAYGGARDLIKGRPEEPRPWWKRPSTIGAAAGTALGLASGLKTASAYPAALIRQISNDPSTAYYEKQRLIELVQQADGFQLRRLAALAATGALTAAAAHTILGTGAFGSAALGGASAFVANNLFNHTRYV